MRMSAAVLLALLCGASAFTPPVTNFAVFSNAEAKMLIRSWNPRPVPTLMETLERGPARQGMLPSSAENLRRFVRARILLEQESTFGAIATFGGEDDSLCLILTRFDGGSHEMILPLWRPSSTPVPIFRGLLVRAPTPATPHIAPPPSALRRTSLCDSPPLRSQAWHEEHMPQAKLDGAKLEWKEDRAAWAEANEEP